MDRDNRVLGRVGARDLTPEEVDYVTAAGGAHTNFCSLVATSTSTGDGDGCGDLDVV